MVIVLCFPSDDLVLLVVVATFDVGSRVSPVVSGDISGCSVFIGCGDGRVRVDGGGGVSSDVGGDVSTVVFGDISGGTVSVGCGDGGGVRGDDGGGGVSLPVTLRFHQGVDPVRGNFVLCHHGVPFGFGGSVSTVVSGDIAGGTVSVGCRDGGVGGDDGGGGVSGLLLIAFRISQALANAPPSEGQVPLVSSWSSSKTTAHSVRTLPYRRGTCSRMVVLSSNLYKMFSL